MEMLADIFCLPNYKYKFCPELKYEVITKDIGLDELKGVLDHVEVKLVVLSLKTQHLERKAKWKTKSKTVQNTHAQW